MKAYRLFDSIGVVDFFRFMFYKRMIPSGFLSN